jgi:hypothetical protein
VDSFLNLPTPIKVLLAVLTGTSLLGAVAMIDPKLIIIVAIGMAILIGALVAYTYFLKWAQARKSKALAGQIAQHGTAAPNAISNAGARAKLDAMKRSFDIGMQKFATSGKDVYSLPWYVVVGEPGAGKTEAIRHCNVGFPPGLQDEMQGVGGTVNMNWWFTNRAVLLDTAGRLMFEEVAPGETQEWPEFLKLLRRNRPNCPINGLLLVIPCDSLIKDTEADITRKAGKIAQQLDVIQRTLDVRFPVFVLITKSDLLDGFREFFDDMDPDSQHQMLGWSNPQPRDVPFAPDQVDQHIQTVVERIRKRRLGLLKDPIPQHGEARRIDEVDALFSLPESFTLAAPRLRSYLEKVFVAGPWSAKPLFLRGIYFTSAVREGAALDLVLAQAIGVKVDALPEGRAWERERAYFLRDLFTEKIFRESGLVTRASNTKALLRGRKIALYACGFGALALILLFTFLSYRQFEESIGEQSKAWSYAKQGWHNGEWHPLVSAAATGEAGGSYDYNGGTAVDPASGAGTLAEFLHKLRTISATDIPIGFVFRPLAHFFHLEGDRKRAQRVVFEGSVVKPLIDADRARMVAPAPAPSAAPAPEKDAVRAAEAIAALVRVEADGLAKSGATEAPAGILKPGVAYATGGGSAATVDQTLPEISDDFVWTYTKNPAAAWPPAWLPAGSASLNANKPIKAGMDRLFSDAATSLQSSEANLGTIKSLRDDLREFRAREAKLNDLAKTDDRTNLDARMQAQLNELIASKKSIDTKLKASHSSGLLKDYSLATAYHDLVDQSKVQSDEAFKIVHNAAANAGAGPQARLFPEILAALDKKHDELVARISDSFSKDEVAELGELDNLLKDFGDGRRMYEVRTKQYQDAAAELAREDPAGSLIGHDWSPLVELHERIGKAREEAKGPQEKLGGKFDACAYFYDRALERRTGVIAARYLSQTRDTFNGKFAFPLVRGDNRRMNREQLAEAGTLLAEWDKDLKSENLKLVPTATAQKLKAFETDTQKLAAAVDAVEANITISLVNYNSSPDKSGLDRLRKIVVDGAERDTSTASDIDIGSGSVFNAYRMTFLDYSSGVQESYPLAVDGYELASRVHGNGTVKVTVPRIGLPIFLAVKADRAMPDMGSLPVKQKILADLN